MLFIRVHMRSGQIHEFEATPEVAGMLQKAMTVQPPDVRDSNVVEIQIGKSKQHTSRTLLIAIRAVESIEMGESS